MTILFAQQIRIVVIEPSVVGHRVWELLEELIRVHGLLVVICSVWDDRRYGLAAGAIAYLVKPVLPSTLLETLQSILG
ncbi:MAG: hypothetical protein KF716_02580 [Anaerolineae bacterium]|nr:hypothetical protein [Anaerolineae bacterium]